MAHALIPALGRQWQADFWVQGQPGLQSEFQDSQDYTEKPCLEKPKGEKMCVYVYVDATPQSCPGIHIQAMYFPDNKLNILKIHAVQTLLAKS